MPQLAQRSKGSPRRWPHRVVKRGDCVAFLGYNSPEMLALLFSCARLGALFMPLNWRLAAPEHGRCCRTARRRC
jgi:acyl-CoA synthetase (AMP-forming)/AMP-acid ligase II